MEFVSENDGSEVWLPLLTVDKTLVPWVLQRLSDLLPLPSTATTETKMEECQRLADQAAQADSKQATAQKVCPGCTSHKARLPL